MNLHPDFNTQHVITIVLMMCALIAFVIIALRLRVKRFADQNLTNKYKNKVWLSPLEARSKYPDVDIFKYRPYAMFLGVIFALVLTTTLMNWTTISTVSGDFEEIAFVDTDIEITPPQTSEPPPPPPPPPPPNVVEVPEELFDDLAETVEFMDQSIEAESVIDAPPPVVENKPIGTNTPPPPPPIRHEDVEEIFKVVEEMPRFPGCEQIEGTTTEKKACADNALFAFIHTNLEYPAYARENNIEGTVVVQFVVNRDGTVQDVTVLRDIGAGCGEEVVRVVGLMNNKNLRWTPGKQRGRPVRVIFIMPVKFKLLTS